MLKRLLLVIIYCFILFHPIPADGQNYGVPNFDYQDDYSNSDATDYPVVTGIEEDNFGNNYGNENIYLRMNRLERAILGANFPQDSLCDRIDRIKKAAQNNNDDSEEKAYNNYSSFNNNSQEYLNFAQGSMMNDYYSNDSYNNQYRPNSYSNSSGLMSLLENIVLPLLLNNNNGDYDGNYNGNYYNDPYYQRRTNMQQNLNYGSRVRILP